MRITGSIRAAMLIATALATPLAAQTATAQTATGQTATGQTAPEPVFTAAGMRGHVAFLADDALEGRGTGTRGYDIAARYVATQFDRLGLKPAGNAVGTDWFQPIRFQERSFGPAGASLRLTGPNGTQSWKNGTAIITRPSPFEANAAFEAPVVFAGFGLDKRDLGFDDYRGLDVKGKIVAVLAGFPKGTNSEIGAHLNAEKAKMAEARGAIAMITVPTAEYAKAFPWSTLMQYATVPRVSFLDPDGKPHVDAPGIRAGATLDTPAAEALFAGAKRSLADVLAEADRSGGKPKGFALATRARFQIATAYKDITSPNVAAVLPGSDPKLAGEYIVVMGHLDHLGIRPEKEGDTIYNGALDNAAGVATVLEVARAFAEAPTKPRRSILFLAVTAEEKGLLGASYFAEHPTIPADGIAGVVNLDMPLLLYDFQDVIAFGAEHSTLGPQVAAAASSLGVTLAPDPTPEEGIFTRSDHYEFVKKGVPAVFLVTGYGGEGRRHWEDFLKSRYHQPNDDLAQAIDWNAAGKFARINYLIARDIADDPARPMWNKGDFFGDTFAPGKPRAGR